MKPGERTYKSASLRISYSTLIPANLRGKLREVTHFKSADPGKGHGTSLLLDVCRDADVRRIVLMLTPTDAHVGAYYVRFGFRLIQESPPLMMREPTTGVRSESSHTIRHGRTVSSGTGEAENSR